MPDCKMMTPFSINLGGYKVATVSLKNVSFDTIEYGSEFITMKKRSTSNGKPIWWKEINVSRMKVKYVLITANKLELIFDENVISVDVSSRTEKNNKDGKYEPS